MKLPHICLLAAIILAGCSTPSVTSVFSVRDGRIMKDGHPYYYIGTNVWYASALAVQNPERLLKELDTLQSLGLKNLRILATDENWEGLDFTLAELGRRDMAAVLYLNNAWEWSADGYRSYLEKAGAGVQPHPAVDGYPAYMGAMSRFASTPGAVEAFRGHVERVVSRYKDNPAVFSWQICNEPRPFSADSSVVDDFVAYLRSTAAFIKSLDPNHLVSTGCEGSWGCENDIDIFVRAHDVPEIDYLTLHIWPYNWGWISADDVEGGVEAAIAHTAQYIGEHLEIARKLHKPVVIEEFGYPRDGFGYVNSAPVAGRDRYYSYVFGRVAESAAEGGSLSGCNFWTWSGYAAQTPGHQFYQEGDDLCGDPSQEAQGLNGVYLTDTSTIGVIRESVSALP